MHLWLHVFLFQANKTKESPHGTCFPSTCIFIHQNRLNLCLHTSGVNKRCFSSLLSSCVVVDGAQTGLLSSLEYSSCCARETAFAFPLLWAFFYNCILTRTSIQTGICFAASCWLSEYSYRAATPPYIKLRKCFTFSKEIVIRRCSGSQTSLREGWLFQIGWIFGKKSKWPLTPPPHFRKIMLQFFLEIVRKKPCIKVQNLQYNPLKLFRKFIRFGSTTRPLPCNSFLQKHA